MSRTIHLHLLGALSAVVALARTPPAVDAALPVYDASAPVSGRFTAMRAESMDALMAAWTAGFTRRQPGVEVVLRKDSRFPTDAFPALLDGSAQLLPFPRELFAAELASYRRRLGGEPLLVCVGTGSRATRGATHALAIYVHGRNPIARLDADQLRGIFGRGGGITRWGQLGLAGEWTQRAVRAHGMVPRRETGNPPGIVNYLEQRLLGGEFRPDLAGHADTAGLPALEAIVRAVAADPGAIGYGAFDSNVAGVRAVPLATSADAVALAGSEEEIARRDYLLSRSIYLCLHRPAGGKPDPGLREFLRFVLSREGQQILAADLAGFLPLPASLAAAERAKLD